MMAPVISIYCLLFLRVLYLSSNNADAMFEDDDDDDEDGFLPGYDM
jgi:hypothetical protein